MKNFNLQIIIITIKFYAVILSKKKYIFTDYVTDIYKYKSSSNTSENRPLKPISKLLLNSLFGRFGLKIYQSTLTMKGRKNIRNKRNKLRNKI